MWRWVDHWAAVVMIHLAKEVRVCPMLRPPIVSPIGYLFAYPPKNGCPEMFYLCRSMDRECARMLARLEYLAQNNKKGAGLVETIFLNLVCGLLVFLLTFIYYVFVANIVGGESGPYLYRAS